MKDSILIFGAGINQLTLIKAANELGVISVVIDPDPETPGEKIADYFYCVAGDDYETTKKIDTIDKNIGSLKFVYFLRKGGFSFGKSLSFQKFIVTVRRIAAANVCIRLIPIGEKPHLLLNIFQRIMLIAIRKLAAQLAIMGINCPP